MNRLTCPLVYFEGIDGSGKSTAASEVAQILSGEYLGTKVTVSDTTGLRTYRKGEIVDRNFTNLNRLEPGEGSDGFKQLIKLSAFTLGRRAADSIAIASSDLVISVRDAHRIEPAVYAGIYCDPVQKISTSKRLKIFDKLTAAPYADSVVHFDVSSVQAQANLHKRDTHSPHESAEKIALAAKELPEVTAAYGELFGVQVVALEGLKSYTSERAAVAIEPLLATPSISPVTIPACATG